MWLESRTILESFWVLFCPYLLSVLDDGGPVLNNKLQLRVLSRQLQTETT